jgi:hypothetical protein
VRSVGPQLFGSATTVSNDNGGPGGIIRGETEMEPPLESVLVRCRSAICAASCPSKDPNLNIIISIRRSVDCGSRVRQCDRAEGGLRVWGRWGERRTGNANRRPILMGQLQYSYIVGQLSDRVRGDV